MRNKTANYFINPSLFLHPFSMFCALQQIVQFYSVNCRPLENAVISSENVDSTLSRTPLSSPCPGQAVKNAPYLSHNVFTTKVLIEDTTYTSSTGDI